MEVKVTSQNEQLAIRSLETLEGRVLEACATGLRRGLLGTVGTAMLEYLSGPRPARIQSISGRLRQGMNATVTVTGNAVIGQIGNNVKYAAFHEFGFHGMVSVRAHTRVVDQTFRGRNDTESYADSIRSARRKAVARGGEVLGFLESRKRAVGRQRTGFVTVQFVRAHRRNVNYPGKPFVRPALEQTAPLILDEINKELATLK